MNQITSQGAPFVPGKQFKSFTQLPWRELKEDALSPSGEVLKAGTKVRTWQTTNFGFVAVHPQTEGVTRFLHKE